MKISQYVTNHSSQVLTREYSSLISSSRAGVGNSFGFKGHMRDKLGIHGPVHVLAKLILRLFVIKQVFSWYLMCFHSKFSYLGNFKCSSRATLRCLAGRMWPAGRTLPRPVLGHRFLTGGTWILKGSVEWA